MVKKKKGISLKLNSFEVELSNRWMYSMMAFFVIALLGAFVYAQAPNPGHDYDDLDLGPLAITASGIGLDNGKHISFVNNDWRIGRNIVSDSGATLVTNALQVVTYDFNGDGFQIIGSGHTTPVLEILTNGNGAILRSDNFEVDGTVTANSFIGNGSQLTGISGSSVWSKSGDNIIYSTSPGTTATVRSSTTTPGQYAALELHSAGTSTRGILKSNALNSRVEVGSLSNHLLSIITNGVERIRVNSNGDVTIHGDLEVSGKINPGKGMIDNGLVVCAGGLSHQSNDLYFCDDPLVIFTTNTQSDEGYGVKTNTFCPNQKEVWDDDWCESVPPHGEGGYTDPNAHAVCLALGMMYSYEDHWFNNYLEKSENGYFNARAVYSDSDGWSGIEHNDLDGYLTRVPCRDRISQSLNTN